MAEVYILCGKVGAGKSTYARRLAQTKRAVILSVDELMLQMEDACRGPRYQRRQEEKCETYFMTLAAQLVSLGVSCILDYGHWTRASRRRLMDFCERQGYAYRLIWVDCASEIRRQRLQRRNEEQSRQPGRHYILTQEMQERFDAWFEEPPAGSCQIITTDEEG